MGTLRSDLAKLLAIVLLLNTWGIHAAQIGGDFSLTDQDGRSFQLSELHGKVVLLFFGYTYCPDICPTELAVIASVLKSLEEAASDVRGVFITIDPERDTPEVLKEYIRHFNKNLIALTGSPDQIAQVAGQYRVKYRKLQRSDGHYTMDHSVQLYVIDRDGSLLTAVPYGLPAEHVLKLIRSLLESTPQDGARAVRNQ